MWTILHCIGKVIAKQGVEYLISEFVPGGSIVNFSRAFLQEYGQIHQQRREKNSSYLSVVESLHEEVPALLQATPEEIEQTVDRVVAEVLPGATSQQRTRMTIYLTQVPPTMRRSLERPEDRNGLTVPAGLALEDPRVLAQLLPPRYPHFAPDEPVPHAPGWRLVRILGLGGFGEVWLARHDQNGEQRAIKFCLDSLARHQLLRHEAAVMTRILEAIPTPKPSEHGIVPLVGHHLEGEIPWLAYPFVQGGDLIRFVQKHWGQDAEEDLADSLSGADEIAREKLALIVDLARVVGRLHCLPIPIVHRDLTPSNILLQRWDTPSPQLRALRTPFWLKPREHKAPKPRGRTSSDLFPPKPLSPLLWGGDGWRLRITDFGIGHVASQRVGDGRTGCSLGTSFRDAHSPRYASPQQRRGAKADVRDDVYALGILSYQLLVQDFQAEHPTSKWQRRLQGFRLAPDLADFLESCWEEHPEDRPANAAVFADGLERLLWESDSIQPTDSSWNDVLEDLERLHASKQSEREWLAQNRQSVPRWRLAAESGSCVEGVYLIALAQIHGLIPGENAAQAHATLINLKKDFRSWDLSHHIYYQLGKLLREGSGVPADPVAAREFFALASAKLSAADVALGEMEFKGEGGPANATEAAQHFEFAWEQEHNTLAAYRLGELFLLGEGRSQNVPQALKFLGLAAGRGLSEAAYLLGELHRRGEQVPEDRSEATRWYLLAVNEGHTGAMLRLADSSEDKQRLAWLLRAAEAGDPEGMYRYASAHKNREGTPKNYEIANRWFLRAAEAGHVDAMIEMADHFRYGRGVPLDRGEARRWLERAITLLEEGLQEAEQAENDPYDARILKALKKQLASF